MTQQLFKMFLMAALAVAIENVAGFPTLFNHRTRLFHNHPQQQQQQQQPKSKPASSSSNERSSLQQQSPQQFLPPHQEQLVLAANSFAPIGLYQGDLLRVNAHPSGGHQQMMPQVPIMAEPNEHRPIFSATHPFEANLYHTSQHGTHHSFQHQIPMAIEADYQEHQQSEGSQLDGGATSHTFPRMQPSQSEVVDKIERHIGQQIEQSLNTPMPGEAEPAASGYQRSSNSGAAKEQKEAAASGEGGEEASAQEGGAEERSQEPEAKKAEESGQEKEHENPPEAFEVHHKKGGKSFQYFHQGHQHP